MKNIDDLRTILKKIDGRSYKAYKDMRGAYDLGKCQLFIDYVQGDPFALPSRLRVRVKNTFPGYTCENTSRCIALSDFLTRDFAKSIKKNSKGNWGSGKSGNIKIDKPGQEILKRTSVIVTKDYVEARFEAGLPAFGRKVAGKNASEMLLREIPAISGSLLYDSVDSQKLEKHIHTCEDADELRKKLDDMGLVAFVKNDAVLPRESGINQRPLREAIPFVSPKCLEVEIELKNRTVKGMGVPKGISLILGGGYHGKSTLLNAIELGVYNHIPGDGREFVVSTMDAVKIRAEDGRSIKSNNISPFINNLPQGKDTRNFSSENASGSTSQAANIVEAIESGAKCMLIDEDTSATNFMIRDERMQKLVPKEKEPITPYIEKARQLYEEHGISTIIVIGGSGSYFDIADTVLCMYEYEAYDMTEKAKELSNKVVKSEKNFGELQNRIPNENSIDPYKGNKFKVSATLKQIQMGVNKIDLSYVEQLVDDSQTRAIAYALIHAKKYMGKGMAEVVENVLKDIEEYSLDVLTDSPKGNLAFFRKQELSAALNRNRELIID